MFLTFEFIIVALHFDVFVIDYSTQRLINVNVNVNVMKRYIVLFFSAAASENIKFVRYNFFAIKPSNLAGSEVTVMQKFCPCRLHR